MASIAVGEVFALLHHGALAARRYFARRRGDPDSVPTHQADLLRLQAIAASLLGFATVVRAARGFPATMLLIWGGFLFSMVIAAGVYWRYPQAAPIAVGVPDWTEGLWWPRYWKLMRYFWAVLATALVVFFVGILLFVADPTVGG